MNKTAFIIILTISAVARASGAEHGGQDETGIPLEQIGWQAANLGILLVAGFFFIRKSMAEAFVNRKKDYLEQSEKTKAALMGAEAALSEIKEKLSNLEKGEKKSLENAQLEAAILTAHMIRDAEVATEKMKKDAEMSIRNELAKAKIEINTSILNQAIVTASKAIADKAQSNKAALETEFIKQLGQVKA